MLKHQETIRLRSLFFFLFVLGQKFLDPVGASVPVHLHHACICTVHG